MCNTFLEFRPPIRFQAEILHDIRIIHTGIHLPVKYLLYCFIFIPQILFVVWHYYI